MGAAAAVVRVAVGAVAVRVEHIGNATLFLADARDVLPTLSADVILTDPVWPNCPPDSVPGSDRPWQLWAEACAVMPTVKRILTVMRCDSDPRFLQHLPPLPFFRCVSLPYAIPGYLGRCLGGDEIAYWLGSPIVPAPGRRLIPGRAPSAQPGQRPPNGHPMSRAQTHFDWLVRWCADDGEVVLDPFLGSGTTGVGCARWGLPFVGVEVHEPYFDLACRRIEQAQRQCDLFAVPAA